MVDVCGACTEAARIIYEICIALEFLHTNDIAHRDLKVATTVCDFKLNIGQQILGWLRLLIMKCHWNPLPWLPWDGDGAGNTVEENSNIFSLIWMH